jgi:prolyl oligopeptidase
MHRSYSYFITNLKESVMKTFILRRVLALCLVLFLCLCDLLYSQKINPPQTIKTDQIDTYFGIKVPDPYRWLEDDTSAAVAQWVQEQNKVTFGYLEKISFREKIHKRLEEIYNYPRYSSPSHRGEYYVFAKNDGLQNQSVYYIQKGLQGAPEVLIDPNSFSPDGTLMLASLDFTKDARYFAYGVSKGGSDWRDIYIVETATRVKLHECIRWVKFSGASWYQNGFFYSRYNAPEDTTQLSSKNENQRVYYHRLGTDQSADELVFEDTIHPLRFNFVDVTDDQRYHILYISDPGTGKRGNALYIRNAANNEKSFRPIVLSFDDELNVVDNIGDQLLVLTNKDAPNWKAVLIDPAHPDEKNWKVILPEEKEPLDFLQSVGGKLIAGYMKDVTTRVYVYGRTGKFEREIKLPAKGVASGFGGKLEDTLVFYTFTSFTFPPAIYQYTLKTGETALFRKSEVKFKPEDFETEQIFYTSKDGTRVPMFLVYKKGVKRDGANPALLYGYGGFNVSVMPDFNSSLIALLEQGFVYALANIRGGGEYGEKWHDAGKKLNKQNVFDDFIAAAEWLIANKYTSPSRLAIQGASNGGLLVGAVMNQCPELFKVALPAVGVMDMLRFQKFTIGWNWKTDYGSSDDSVEFATIYKYSPLHNIREGINYPATLATTADHDDRVVPAHSFKWIATLQEKFHGPNPVLIRIETKSGHGASNLSKQLAITADQYAFMMHNLGVTPVFEK